MSASKPKLNKFSVCAEYKEIIFLAGFASLTSLPVSSSLFGVSLSLVFKEKVAEFRSSGPQHFLERSFFSAVLRLLTVFIAYFCSRIAVL